MLCKSGRNVNIPVQDISFLRVDGRVHMPQRVKVWVYKHDIFYLPPVFEKWQEVLFWGPSPYPPSPDVLPYISVAIKASLLKLGMCNICKYNIANMFLDFFKILNCSFDRIFFLILVRNLL